MAEEDDDLSLLLHTYRLTAVCVDSLELIALPAARRLAEAGVEGQPTSQIRSSQRFGRTQSMGAPLQVRQALADLLFEEDDVEGEHEPDIGV